MAKPKITLDNFQYAGKGATYWLENFDLENLSGKNILTAAWNQVSFIDSDDTYGTGYSNLGTIKAFTDFYEDGNPPQRKLIAFDDTYLFHLDTTIPAQNFSRGELHKLVTTGSGTTYLASATYPDVFLSTDNYIIYTSANQIGIGYYGTCKSGSGTTTIIDADGRNFTNLGVLNNDAGTTTPSKYVYNIENEEEYTITAVGTTTETNDTLTVDAGTANGQGDEFIVFVDNVHSFGKTSSGGSNDYNGQTTLNRLKRQIALLGDDYWFTNGNYLASLNIDLSDRSTGFSAEAKQLPYGTDAECISVNNGKMLVGGKYRERGKILTWDTFSNGWNSILDTDLPVHAAQPYKDGWVILVGNKIYYTNGYDKTYLTEILDTNIFRYNAISFNSMKIYGDKIFIGVQGSIVGGYREKGGIHIYDIKSGGWTMSKSPQKGFKFSSADYSPSAIYPAVEDGLIRIFHSRGGTINYMSAGGSSTEPSVATFYMTLPYKMRLNKVELNISYNHHYGGYNQYDYENTLNVAYSDGRRNLLTRTQVSDSSTSTTIYNSQGATIPAYVGAEVTTEELNGTSPVGEVSWITAITNPATANETWTVSPAFSADFSDTADIFFSGFRNAGTITLTFDENMNYLQTLEYNLNDFYSDKLYLQVRLDGTDTIQPISLHSINIY